MGKKVLNNGFTLIELLIVVTILAVVLTGLMQLFIYTSLQAELSGNKTIAISEALGQIEEIRNTPFDDIFSTYDNTTFPLSQLTGTGFIYIDNSNTELLGVKVSVCWRNKSGRVIGEDSNINGILDSGEDLNSNSEVDSDATLLSMVTRR